MSQKPALLIDWMTLRIPLGEKLGSALPTEANAAFTEISTNVSDVIKAVWPILASVVGGFALMKLFKKGANRAV